MKSQTTILLAEEDAATRAFLADNLTADGYERARRRRQARRARRRSRPPARPRASATSTATRWGSSTPSATATGSRRGSTPTTPLIVLTAPRRRARARALPSSAAPTT